MGLEYDQLTNDYYWFPDDDQLQKEQYGKVHLISGEFRLILKPSYESLDALANPFSVKQMIREDLQSRDNYLDGCFVYSNRKLDTPQMRQKLKAHFLEAFDNNKVSNLRFAKKPATLNNDSYFYSFCLDVDFLDIMFGVGIKEQWTEIVQGWDKIKKIFKEAEPQLYNSKGILIRQNTPPRTTPIDILVKRLVDELGLETLKKCLGGFVSQTIAEPNLKEIRPVFKAFISDELYNFGRQSPTAGTLCDSYSEIKHGVIAYIMLGVEHYEKSLNQQKECNGSKTTPDNADRSDVDDDVDI